MSDSSDNNDLFHDNVFCSSTNSEDIQFMNELLGKDTSSATSSPVKKKKKKSKKKSKKYTTKKTSQIASPPIMPDEISLRASCEYFYEDIITYIIMKNFQGITAISVEKQAERLVKTFGEAGHLLRFKAFSQNTGIPNMLLSLMIPFTFNHNKVNTTLDWSYFPVTDKSKKSKKSDKNSMKVSLKPHEETSKPEKDSKKTSKNSKKKNKKKKKKSSDKKQNKNMDLIKLLLQILN
ncbi:hypothetical protein RclHR1_18560001 [Rhizophagus clarus]|uniref:Uncharacterized protein n=1 Tax=Rhizophagus clarus TaxID=94130 RepID=A0A2Z6RFT9_9GLOM|nr:hypothetical protein RclHR1_18560001 [Rhizophagus clarus]